MNRINFLIMAVIVLCLCLCNTEDVTENSLEHETEMEKIGAGVCDVSNQMLMPNASTMGITSTEREIELGDTAQWFNKTITYQIDGETVVCTLIISVSDVDGNALNLSQLPDTFKVREKSIVKTSDYASSMNATFKASYKKSAQIPISVDTYIGGSANGEIAYTDGFTIKIDSALYTYSGHFAATNSTVAFEIKIYFSADNGKYHGSLTGSANLSNINATFNPENDLNYALSGNIYYENVLIGTIEIDENGSVVVKGP